MGSPYQHDMAGIELIVDTLRIGAKKPGDLGTLVTAEGIVDAGGGGGGSQPTPPAQSVAEVTDVTPTAAELTTAFGEPAAVGRGYTNTIDDGGADASVYLVVSTGTSWFYAPLTKAV